MATRKSAPTKTRKRSPLTSAASDAIDAQLARYRSMRDFGLTTEPSGGGPTTNAFALRKPTVSRGLPFVIQKHAASHLHYDFRLSWGGVLKSWAVAKGPSYNPQERRLAIEVEDHPLEYGGFEGIIPQGQYGGGTVMIWDQGTWWPQLGSENVDACLHTGHLKFELNGSKLKGKWALIRMNHPAANGPSSSAKPQWLLIKEHDKYQRGPTDPPIADERPNSAITGRSIPQIATAQDHVWNSNRPERNSSPNPPPDPPPNPASAARSKTPSPRPRRIKLDALPREPQPDFISPQLAFEATTAPATDDWLNELKLDGYRIQARKSGAAVALLTRKGLDWTHRMPAVAAAIAQLPTRDCTLDGEVVVLAPDGNSSFALLQASFQDTSAHPLTYFLFDLLHLDGHSTRDLALRERKQILADLLPPDDAILRLSEDIVGNGNTVFHQACKLHAEGIVSKRADAPYRSARSSDWIKSKCLREQEFVIAGFTLSTEGPDRVGSLLLGYYAPSSPTATPAPASRAGVNKTPARKSPKPRQVLLYAGRTGTGFSQQLRRDLFAQLAELRVPEPAFDRISNAAADGALWVRPVLVAQVRFATWTADNLVRQAAFLGLREDKPASEVVRESPTVAPTPKQHAASRPATAQPSASEPKPPRSPTPGTRASLHPQTLHELSLPAPKPKSKPTADSPPALRLTHPSKILDPESGLTKQQLADFYAAVADRMIPHIANRPLSLVRCPEGAGKPCFFQKHVNNTLPPGIGSISVTDKKSGKPEPYITLDNPSSLISLAQLSALEIHPWGSTNADLEHPDRLILDLDPDPNLPWSTLSAAAAEVRQRLKQAGLISFLKLTGGKGLHIVAPILPTLTWDELKAAAHAFVLRMERENPSLYLTKMTKSSRTGKIFLDYLRNQRGATAVAPFSPRASLGAHVSLPLPWSALNQPSLPIFSVHDLNTWRSRLRTDPWKSLPTTHQQLHPSHFAAI